ncbi:MAG: hypothetical protein L0Z53_14400 [Acidobacteriales bacterium]|nr:hypothetical protein [Terriglobales bacterium]
MASKIALRVKVLLTLAGTRGDNIAGVERPVVFPPAPKELVMWRRIDCF